MIYEIGKLKFDFEKLELTGPGIGIPEKITPLMGKLLKYFILNKNRTISIDELLDNVWDGKKSAKRSLYTHKHDLKKILAVDDSLVFDNVYRKGYGLKDHAK